MVTMAVALAAESPVSRRLTLPEGEKILGAAAAPGHTGFFTWGTKLRHWQPGAERRESRVLAEGPFGEGGCTTDLDGDGKPEVVVVRGEGLGKMLWLRPPRWTFERVDDEMEIHDCLGATLFGRRGLLVIQRGMQIRFYERLGTGKWKSRDIYSIYTPSYQAGLALADVDGDGRVDILCGNYWVQSPKTWEESWRLFAINTWSEQQESATFRLLGKADGSGEFVAQAHLHPARLARFDRTADPKLQWQAKMLAPALPLANIHGLAMWNGWLLAGEKNGSASRLLRVDPGGSGTAEVIAAGQEIVAILPEPRSASKFVTVETDGVTLWRYRVAPPPRK